MNGFTVVASRFFAACFFVWAFMPPFHAYSDEALNVRLVGHSDLQGRNSLPAVVKGNYAYIGHHRGEALNPLTGILEENGD